MTNHPDILQFSGLEELPAISSQLLQIGKDIPVWMFRGQMGAGKTTLIKDLCRHLGVTVPVQSPTFSIVNEYEHEDGLVYHFDFYRIKEESEALDLGVEEYFDSGDFCFVEWPDRIASLWPEEYLLLELMVEESGARVMRISRQVR
ncbi:tRNA (adenosine(37)-N6)-threonylcarbamoyltransferase complex ATPase subunit type 1 TsaE [Dyadobacter sandarakinus]|uniref:tRNA threonylcarbamoyladenosine biosynthesis protein TsaE n=1 Tax=Dyadobacter sandarakinus TaxID=2747268 RepID=A0ABX7I7U4_9BACT|nr:tRNA (adenosine(37)-N6)-threonylcarbamoyltransferase complex ATPase subunit type 1 TsaE [Dyadobacter sandarakinus]QRR01798.1 tRNA (adenosine(37)-N6)-threonylcarbamoyltransferase complex ATPase subunit type 1 TsaE [Dyadobacter sandarakinus]